MNIQDELIRRIQANADNGAEADWLIADDAADVVGRNVKGETRQIVEGLTPQRSPDWLEERAHAGLMFRQLRQYDSSVTDWCRVQLPHTYFTACWEAHNKDAQAWPPGTLMEFLQQAADDGTEIGAFRALFASTTPVSYERRFQRVLKGVRWLWEMSESNHVSQPIRRALKALLDEVEKRDAE